LKQAAIVFGAAFVLATPLLATPASANDGYGPVYDGSPYYGGGPYYTGPYKGAFAKMAHPGESRCLMERRARPAAPHWWSGNSDWSWFRSPTGTYTVQVCR
jgi:hypothetical protein